MRIRHLRLLEGARRAEGLAAVIDVFRAFSTACCLAAGGVARLVVVERTEEAFALGREHPDWRLVGERGGRKLPGFDHANSPSEILEADVEGATVVFTTSAGTRGLLLAAGRAEEVVTASFRNAGAVIEHVRRRRPAVVSIVSLGAAGAEETVEDNLCGDYLAAAFAGVPADFDAIDRTIRASASAARFGDPALPWFPAVDRERCLELDRHDFVLRLETGPDGLRELVRVEAGAGLSGDRE
jgi:2-phosphosulfolactate phosphatase